MIGKQWVVGVPRLLWVICGLSNCRWLVVVVLIFVGVDLAKGDTIGFWRLNGDAVDSSGNGNDGIVYGSPTWLPGGGASFDGVSNSYIDIPGSSNWNFPSGFTLEADVRFTDSSDIGRGVFGKHIGGVGTGYYLGYHLNGHFQFFVNNNIFTGQTPVLSTQGIYNDGEWHHIIASFDGATGTQYLAVYDYDSHSLLRLEESLSQTTSYTSFCPADFRIGTVESLNPPGYNGFIGDVANVKLSTPVPEPASLVLWSGLFVTGLIASRRRRRLA